MLYILTQRISPILFAAALVVAVLPSLVLSQVGEWSPPSSWPTVPIHVHVLPNGQVLAWSHPGGVVPGYIFLWDPATDTFTDVGTSTSYIFCSGHAFLPDGRLLVTGGHADNYVGLRDTNIFNFNTNSWTQVANMNAGRWYPTNTALANGEMLVISGTTTCSTCFNRLPQVWRTTGGWRNLTSAQRTLSMYPFMYVAPNGRVFNAGPDQTTRYLNTAGSGSWTTVGNSNYGLREAGSSVMYDNGKVMIVGGADPPTNTAEVIDLNAPGWRYTNSMSFARRYHNATLLPDGKVLVTGGSSSPGNDAAGAVLEAEMWDPATENWTTLASMQVPRLYHSTAVLLPDGRVLSGGGGQPTAANDTDHFDAEIFSPPYLFQGGRPTITSAPTTTVGYGTSFFVGTLEAASITQVTLIRLSSVTHAFNQNQRINHLSFSQTSDGLNVTAPASRNLSPPGHYMLFILDANGAPSVASIIRIG